MIKFECFPNDKDDKFKNITANIHEDTLSMIGKIWQVKGIRVDHLEKISQIIHEELNKERPRYHEK